MDRYAVFGNPIAQSKSPLIHSWFAEQTGEALTYRAILAAEGGFAEAWQSFVADGGKGGNVTAPFKADAFALAQRLTERAQQAGAVNTLYIDEQGLLWGDNTDGVGLVADLQRLKVQLPGAHILLLGAGGASRGVVGPLLSAGAATVHIANRTLNKAAAIAELFNDQVSVSDYLQIPAKRWDLIVNATSSGLSQHLPALDVHHVATAGFVYDMVYSKEPTAFIRWCQQQSAVPCADGLGMLVAQAAESFYIWRGVRPKLTPVLQRLTELLRQ